jgi:polyhydroxyalkanoate synthesis regulator phasin
MAEKVKIPGFIKDGAKAALEPLNRFEDRISEMLKKVAEEKNVTPAELKKALKDALKWAKGTRTDIEKSFSEGVTKTLSVLNLPTRDDLSKVEKRVTKLSKDVKSIQNKVAGKKPATAAKKKVAVKKTEKKATKKAAKKPAVRKA